MSIIRKHAGTAIRVTDASMFWSPQLRTEYPEQTTHTQTASSHSYTRSTWYQGDQRGLDHWPRYRCSQRHLGWHQWWREQPCGQTETCLLHLSLQQCLQDVLSVFQFHIRSDFRWVKVNPNICLILEFKVDSKCYGNYTPVSIMLICSLNSKFGWFEKKITGYIYFGLRGSHLYHVLLFCSWSPPWHLKWWFLLGCFVQNAETKRTKDRRRPLTYLDTSTHLSCTFSACSDVLTWDFSFTAAKIST